MVTRWFCYFFPLDTMETLKMIQVAYCWGIQYFLVPRMLNCSIFRSADCACKTCARVKNTRNATYWVRPFICQAQYPVSHSCKMWMLRVRMNRACWEPSTLHSSVVASSIQRFGKLWFREAAHLSMTFSTSKKLSNSLLFWVKLSASTTLFGNEFYKLVMCCVKNNLLLVILNLPPHSFL